MAAEFRIIMAVFVMFEIIAGGAFFVVAPRLAFVVSVMGALACSERIYRLWHTNSQLSQRLLVACAATIIWSVPGLIWLFGNA